MTLSSETIIFMDLLGLCILIAVWGLFDCTPCKTAQYHNIINRSSSGGCVRPNTIISVAQFRKWERSRDRSWYLFILQ